MHVTTIEKEGPGRRGTAGLVWTALALGLVYVFATPPFTVPDEGAHFWRGLAVAQGHWLPAPRPAPVPMRVDDGFKVLYYLSVQVSLERTGGFGIEALRTVARIPPGRTREPIAFVPLYTPLSYIPQALAAAATSVLRARPLVTFYAGRISNLAVTLALIALAIRIAPQCALIFGVIALLPMTLFQMASWSADSMTIGLSFLLTALVVRVSTAEGRLTSRQMASLAAVAFLLGLCKPAYFLLPLAVVAIPRRRFPSTGARAGGIGIVALATAMGTAVSMFYLDRAYFNMRPNLPVDPAGQWQCVLSDPFRFAGVLARDAMVNGRFYVEEAVGRFGPNEIKLPMIVIAIELLMVAAAALNSRVTVRPAFRLAAVLIFGATAAGILTSQYVIWSVVCGDTIEGVQGRYFLPVLPLLLVALNGGMRKEIAAGVWMAIAVACNAVAIGTLLTWYW